MSSELKPCGHCGTAIRSSNVFIDEGENERGDSRTLASLMCHACGARGPRVDGDAPIADLFAAWNRRSPDPKLTEAVALLEAEQRDLFERAVRARTDDAPESTLTALCLRLTQAEKSVEIVRALAPPSSQAPVTREVDRG